MEDTQTPNPHENAPHQDSEATHEEAPSPKKKGGLLKILIAVAIVAIGGGVAAWLLLGQAEETPPSLTLGAGKFQGQSLGEEKGSLVYDQADVDNFQPASGADFKTSPGGVNYFELVESATIGEITDVRIMPEDGLQILVAYYSPGEAALGLDKCYHIYPVGPYDKSITCEITAPLNLALPAESVVAIIASTEFKYDASVLSDVKTPPSSFSFQFIADDEYGWTLKKASASDFDHPRAQYVWQLTGANKFEKVTDPANADLVDGNALAWFYLGTDTGTADTTVPTPAVCGDGVTEGTEECDGGTDCEADCTLIVTAPECGNGIEEDGEDCDDGNIVDGDGCSATCVTEQPVTPECGNGIEEDGEDCDDGNTVDGDGCSSTCQTEAAESDADVCGDGVINAGEECDTEDLGGETCSSVGDYTGGLLKCNANCEFTTSLCTDATTTTTTTTTTATEAAGTTAGTAAGTTTTGGWTLPSAPTESNVKIQRIEYISDIPLEFGEGTPAEYPYDMYLFDIGHDSSENHLDPPSTFVKEDSRPDIAVSAIKVEVDSSSGGPAILKQLAFETTGYKRTSASEEEVATMLDLFDNDEENSWWCMGNISDGDWEIWRVLPSNASNTPGYVSQLVLSNNTILQDVGPIPLFSASVPPDTSINATNFDTNLTIEPGEWAIFVLIMHNMDTCHDESVGADLTSRSQTNFHAVEFVDRYGLPVKDSSDVVQEQFANNEILNGDEERWTYWE
ncbi:DUF4215 domain-containing protein [Patescibacteria group bacterium]